MCKRSPCCTAEAFAHHLEDTGAHIPRARSTQLHVSVTPLPRPGHTALGPPAARGAAPHTCLPSDTVSTGMHAGLEPQNSQLTRAVRHQEG